MIWKADTNRKRQRQESLVVAPAVNIVGVFVRSKVTPLSWILWQYYVSKKWKVFNTPVGNCFLSTNFAHFGTYWTTGSIRVRPLIGNLRPKEEHQQQLDFFSWQPLIVKCHLRVLKKMYWLNLLFHICKFLCIILCERTEGTYQIHGR